MAVHAERIPDHIAVLSDIRNLSYSDFLSQIKAASAYLQKFHIRPESVVGVSISDEADHLIVSLAVMALGANQVTLATFDEAKARVRLADRAHVTHVISHEKQYYMKRAVPVEWGCVEPFADPSFKIPVTALSGKLYLKTSGTTTDGNLVPFSDNQIGEQANRHLEYANERLLRLASLEHNNSKRHRLYCAWNGGTNIFRPKGEVDIAQFCLKYDVTCLDISRMHALAIASSSSSSTLSQIKIRTGGSSIPIDLRRSIEANTTRKLYVRYAATECGAIAMAGPGEHDDDESVGCPLPGVELEIVGPDGAVPKGESGSIRLRAPGMATSYYDNISGSTQSFRNGWFYPGDIGRLRADGQLIVHGRQDDMMILNGVNIYPTEIERVLERHPSVKVAAALPISSPTHGQIPVAAVELNVEATITVIELQRYAREELGLRMPRRIMILDSLPRNPQGKIVRHEIAKAIKPIALKND